MADFQQQRITFLEEENTRLRAEIETLRARDYEGADGPYEVNAPVLPSFLTFNNNPQNFDVDFSRFLIVSARMSSAPPDKDAAYATLEVGNSRLAPRFLRHEMQYNFLHGIPHDGIGQIFSMVRLRKSGATLRLTPPFTNMTTQVVQQLHSTMRKAQEFRQRVTFLIRGVDGFANIDMFYAFMRHWTDRGVVLDFYFYQKRIGEIIRLIPFVLFHMFESDEMEGRISRRITAARLLAVPPDLGDLEVTRFKDCLIQIQRGKDTGIYHLHNRNRNDY